MEDRKIMGCVQLVGVPDRDFSASLPQSLDEYIHKRGFTDPLATYGDEQDRTVFIHNGWNFAQR